MNVTDKKILSPAFLFKVFLILALPVFPCFNDLGNLPLRIWDEARQAHNAYEMYYNHQYWVPTFDGAPDNFGTKPAVFIWMEVLSMKIFGVNEFALRFPAAASAYLLGILMMAFLWYYSKNFVTAFIGGILLFGSEALIRIHVARTADFDAPVAAFGTIAALSFFVFLQNNKKLFWYATCAFFALAVLMKGTAGFLLMPPLLMYALMQKKVLKLLKSADTYIGVLGFLFVTIGYYLIRNHYQPGYAALVVLAELGTMYFDPAQGHSASFWFYIQNFYTRWFQYYWWLVPAGFATIFYTKNLMVKQLGIFSSVMLVGFWLIISISATKLFWYDVPVYAFAVMLCCCFFYFLFELIILSDYRPAKALVIQIALAVILFFYGFKIIKNAIIDPQESSIETGFYAMAKYLQQTNKTPSTVPEGFKILSGNAYAPHHTFYIKQMQERHQRVSHAVFTDLQVNDSVMLFEQNMQELVMKKFHATLLSNNYSIFAYRLDSLKTNEHAE